MKSKEEFAHHIAVLAQRAVLYEVSTTPKPGLVDRDNPGAHRDMDFFTFMASSSVLYKGFYDCTLEGLYFDEDDNTKLLDRIRKPGIKCEKRMFEATNGVNTHKGIIFSIGILCAVVGNLYRKNECIEFTIEGICEEVKNVARELTLNDFKGVMDKKELTHGERLYKEYGYKGIRGEVESGFSSVRRSSLEVLRNWNGNSKLPMNDLFLDILINLMAYSEDTNVIIRGGIESLVYVKEISTAFLEAGGMRQPDAKEKLQKMNCDFIKKNISPGGSADLLAVSIFLGMLEGILN
jgi:triphosphoribosyl-dephospho-CoA synthase